MRASGLSPVRQIRTKRKMSGYSSDLECFVERTTPTNYWPVYIHISFPSPPGAVSQSYYAATNSLFYGSRA
jgi:hypothetical protein